MKTIWKFPLKITDQQYITLPRMHRWLDVQTTGRSGAVCLWALVNTEQPKITVSIEMFGTGQEMESRTDTPNRAYLGTAQQHDGALIWHVFVRLDDIGQPVNYGAPREDASEADEVRDEEER